MMDGRRVQMWWVQQCSATGAGAGPGPCWRKAKGIDPPRSVGEGSCTGFSLRSRDVADTEAIEKLASAGATGPDGDAAAGVGAAASAEAAAADAMLGKVMVMPITYGPGWAYILRTSRSKRRRSSGGGGVQLPLEVRAHLTAPSG